MLINSFAEVLSIGLVLPFLSALTSPDYIFNLPSIKPIIQTLDISGPEELVLLITWTFGLAALIAGFMRLLMLWCSTRLAYATGIDLSISMYMRTLYQSYSVHSRRNSSEVIDGIFTKVSNATNTINNVLILLSSSVLLISILGTLLVIDPIMALTTFSGFGLIYFSIIFLTRNRLALNSKICARKSTEVLKSLQEGLGGIRDIILDGSQEVFCKIYNKADLELRRAQASNMFIGSSPRYAVEALGMVFIGGLAYYLIQRPEGIKSAIPILGVLALGAQRLLPTLQQLYSSWVGIRSSNVSLQDVLESLDQALPSYASKPKQEMLPFKDTIKLKNISFRYDAQTPYVLKKVNLTIPKGSIVGFIGATGSGKSTLLDIAMGLLPPTEGELLIDNHAVNLDNCRAWQAHISHVPQAIYLADCSIEENIAFGIPANQINHQRVRQAAQQAQIANIIEGWPLKYQTFVGERGIRLSGGQRQRIGIARALYKKADVIILDEATSALDNDTEEAVMLAIENLGKEITVLIIAHRLTTLKKCTQIIKLDELGVKYFRSYQDLLVSDGIKTKEDPYN